MNKRITKIGRAAALLMALLMLAGALVACGEKTVSVKVSDMGVVTDIETSTGKTVSEALGEADIKLGDKDETEPAADSKITEDTKEITVKRYAKVTVVYGSDKKEVELVGGTVAQAVQAAGFKTEDGVLPDKAVDDYLTDGMTINLVKSKKVSITVDGETKEVTTSAATVEALLKEQKITLGDDDEISEKKDAEVTDGMKITVKRVTYKEETKTEKVDYETKEEYSDSVAAGTSQVTQEGVEGEKTVTYKVKYVDGKEDSREKIKEEVTKEPVTKIVTYGSQSSDGGSDGSGDSSGGDSGASSGDDGSGGGRTVVSQQKVPNCDGSDHGYIIIYYSDGSEEYVEY